MRSKRTLKKEILKIKYLEAEHDDCLEIYHEAKRKLETAIRELHYNLNVVDEVINPAEVEEPTVSQGECEELLDFAKEKKDPPLPWVKKLFRKIVMIIHPDKLSKNLSEDDKLRFDTMYQEAKDAMETADHVKIVLIASDLHIDIPLAKLADFQLFREKAASIQSEINAIKGTVFWVWEHSTAEQKNKIAKEFIKSTGWSSPQSMRKKARKGPGKHPGKSISWARKSALKTDDTQ